MFCFVLTIKLLITLILVHNVCTSIRVAIKHTEAVDVTHKRMDALMYIILIYVIWR